MRLSIPALTATTALLIDNAVAGAGAQVKVCVWFSTKPIKPIQIQWQTCGSATHCMYCSNQINPIMTVTESGLTCYDIGKVESKSSSSGGDACATDKSHWELSYNAGVYSGSCVSTWSGGGTRHNYIDLEAGRYSPGTSVCGSQAACPDTKTDWDAGTAPNIYFVFRPEQKGSSSWITEFYQEIWEIIVKQSEQAAEDVEVHLIDEPTVDEEYAGGSSRLFRSQSQSKV